MEDSRCHSRVSSDTPTDDGEVARARLKLFFGAIASQTEESRRTSEELGVGIRVRQVLQSIEDKVVNRRKKKILQALEGCKSRIVSALKGCNEEMSIFAVMDIPGDNHSTSFELVTEENIPWNDEALPKRVNNIEFEKEPTDEMRRRKEQSRIKSGIDRYIKSRKNKILNMEALFEWMSNFTFDVTWDEIGMSPTEDREKDESESYRCMVLALQRIWQCARKMQELIELLASDDIYDVISGNYPEHIAADRRKRGILAWKMWCSHRLRVKLDEYEKMRRSLELKQENKTATEQQTFPTRIKNHVTVKSPEEDSGAPKDTFKGTETTILQEVNRCWKHAIGDISFYMQEVKSHRFSKISCRVRLGRAMLMLEFVCAAIEGKILEAEKKERELAETKALAVRCQEDSHHMKTKLAEANKTNQAAQRKISTLKIKLEVVTTSNQKLLMEIGDVNDKVESLMTEIEELQQLTDQQDFEENLSMVEDNEIELVESETRLSEIWAELEDCRKECDTVQLLLLEEKEINSSLSKDIVVLEEEKAKSQAKLADIERKLSDQGTNVTSLRLMVYYKDEVIRRLKRAVIELKSHSIAKKDTGEVVRYEKEKVDVPTEPTQERRIKKGQNNAPSTKSVVKIAGGKRRDQPKTTKVIGGTVDYKKLKDEYHKTFREMAVAKRELQKERNDFDNKLRVVLQEERRKSLIESMQIEEDMQLLCYDVKDEMMRVQKEMRKFVDNVGEELNSVLGFKGHLMDVKLPKAMGRAAGGLKTDVNISFDSSTGPDPLQLGDEAAMFEFAPDGDFMQIIGPMMFGQDMFPGPDKLQMLTGQEETSTGKFEGMPARDSFAGIPSRINSQTDELADQQGKIYMRQAVNYWKSMRNALLGESVDAETKSKENDQIYQSSDILTQQQKAKGEKQKYMDKISVHSEVSMTNTASTASNASTKNIPGVSAGKPASANENRRNNSEDISIQKSHDNLDVISSSAELSRVSVFVDDKNASGLFQSLEDQSARLGDRRRSSEINFHLPALPIEVKKPEAEPSKKEGRIRGFYGLGPGRSSNFTANQSQSKLPGTEKFKPKIQEEPEPVREPGRFVRVISQQVAEFLGNLSARLTEIIRQHKEEMTSKMLAMEERMLHDKVKYKDEIDCVQAEKTVKENELKHVKRALSDIGLAMGSTSMIDDRSFLPQGLVQKLKETEIDLDDATLRFYEAAQKHEANAHQYRYFSKSLERRLKMAEEEKFRLQKNVKKEVQTTRSLRIQLYNVLNSQKQTLFLRLRHHKHNANIVGKANDVDNDPKKVALGLMRRSMLYPEESLRLLVQHYCEYVKFMDVQERVRQQIVKEEKSSAIDYRKSPRNTRRKTILTNLLAGLAVRRELAKQKMAEKRKLLAAEWNKMFIKMALKMYKLSMEQQDLSLVQPEILQVYGKAYRRSLHNTPVPRDLPNLTMLSTKSDIVRFPKITPSPPEVRMPPARDDGKNLFLKGHKPPLNMQRLEAAVPNWFPEESLFCPSSRSGNIPPTNSHASMSQFQRRRGYKDVETSANEIAWVKPPEFRAEIPRIMELEIQTGLREAKKVMNGRLRVGMPIASSTCIEAMPLSSSTIANRHYNSPLAQYEKYSRQNIGTYWPGDQVKTNEDLSITNSLENLLSSISCPLPPIPTHRSAVTGQKRKTQIKVAMPEGSFHRPGDVFDFSSPSTRSPSQTTAGLLNR